MRESHRLPRLQPTDLILQEFVSFEGFHHDGVKVRIRLVSHHPAAGNDFELPALQ